jgi:uncharacterized UBP type Zn finger protein
MVDFICSKCFLLHCERARAVHLCLLQAAKVLSQRRLRAARLQVFARSQVKSNLLQLFFEPIFGSDFLQIF